MKNEEKPLNNTKDSSFYYYVLLFICFLNGFTSQGIIYGLPKTIIHIYHYDTNDPIISTSLIYNTSSVSRELLISYIASCVLAFLTGILLEFNYVKKSFLLKFGIILSFLISFFVFFIENFRNLFPCILKVSITVHYQILNLYLVEAFDTKHQFIMFSFYNIIRSLSYLFSPYCYDLMRSYSFTLNYLVYGMLLVILFLTSLVLK